MIIRRLLGSIRFRITVSVVLLFGGTLSVASMVFVERVEATLIDNVQQRNLVTLDQMRAELASGMPPRELRLPDIRLGTEVQMIDPSGNVVAATAGTGKEPLIRLPLGPDGASGGPMTSVVLRSDGPAPAVGASPREFAVAALDLQRPDVILVVASPLDTVRESIDTMTHAMWFAVPTLVLLIAMTVWFLTGRALHPVAAITTRVEEISASTLHERVPETPGSDEIAHLARTMNSMLERLQAASALQRQFVSDASHELRSPVAAIRAELEVTQSQTGCADWDAVARNVLAENERLERIIGDLLTLARFDEQPQLDRERLIEVRLDDLVRMEASRTRRLQVDTTGVRPASVLGRAEELTRMIGHLGRSAE